jgi:predicted permease
VDGRFFEVMGLRPVLGRLIGPDDDGAKAAGVVVLTNRFWTGALGADPSVVGKTVRLGGQSAVVIGVLEPAAPYPEETEIIANMVTSPHHLSATMVTEREHRMTEVFGRMAPGADLQAVRAELQAAYTGITGAFPAVYTPRAHYQVSVVPLREQLTARARTILLVLLGASSLIFVVACANVVNLVLARTVRREPELAVRAAILPNAMALRRTLLAESLLLCGLGALAGVLIAQPMVTLLARFTARYSVRALDFQLDSTPLWIGVALALIAAVLLAFVPSLPAPGVGSRRSTAMSKRRLQGFAIAQIAASFLMLAGAATVIRTLLAFERSSPGFQTENVLAVNMPTGGLGRTAAQTRTFLRDVRQQLSGLPGIQHVVVGSNVPWRDVGGGPTRLNPRPGGMQFAIEGGATSASGDRPQARGRAVSPGFFSALRIPLLAGREFTDDDTTGSERVVIISASIARAMFPGQDAVNRQFHWADPVARFVNFSEEPRRVVGVVADLDDEQVDPRSPMTVYHPMEQEGGGSRLFVVTQGANPYGLVPQIERSIRELAPNQPLEQAATLDDIRARVLSPARVNTIVLSVFAGVALMISVIGIGAVLAFSVSGRRREFGIRLAIGCPPVQLLLGVLRQGVVMAAAGIAVGGFLGWALSALAGAYVSGLEFPGALALIGAGSLLVVATVVASLVPAVRAGRTDPTLALRTE